MQRQRVRAGIAWGAATGALIAGYTLIDGYAVKVLLLSPILVDYVGNCFRLPFLLPAALRDRAGFADVWRAQWRSAIVVAVLGPLGYVLVLYAMRLAPLSHVAPAREVSMLFAALIGGRLLGEGDRALATAGRGVHRRRRGRAGAGLTRMRLVGVDFTCNPSRRKPVTLALGRLDGDALCLDGLESFATLDGFDAWLATPGPWLGAFDFPFGLPRAFVAANGLGTSCAEVIAAVHARCPTRMAWRALIDAWGNTQPAGRRLLHRRTDAACSVTSTSPLQTRYVPVGLMYYEGVARLVRAGVTMPALHDGDPSRIALEGYPRRLAHALIERRSYKNQDVADRTAAREAIVGALASPRADSGPVLRLGAAMRRSLVADPSGDRLDAVLCLVQAAVASRRAGFGLPSDVDPVEGWIVG